MVIVSTSGVEMAGPIGLLLGASSAIATKLQSPRGDTGVMEFWPVLSGGSGPASVPGQLGKTPRAGQTGRVRGKPALAGRAAVA